MTEQSTQRKEAALAAVSTALQEAQNAGLIGLVFGILTDMDSGKTQSIMVASGSAAILPHMFAGTIERFRKDPKAVRLIDATFALCMLQLMVDDIKDAADKETEEESCNNPVCPEHGLFADLLRKGKRG